jgi:transcriptional repressor NF-X1
VQQLKCTNECLVAKRNARLAEALGISTEGREKPVTYHDELITFARSNAKFLGLVEKSFAEFVLSEKKTQVLPHMPMERRKFVHDLAAVYRMDVQMVDQEPHRSVQLIRRIDTRIPSPTLSSTITSSAAPSLGKLADLRAPSGPSLRPLRPPSSTPSRTTTPVGSSQRGWTSVVGGPAIAANPSPSTSSWAAPQSGRSLASQPAVISAQPASITRPSPSLEVSSVDVPDSWEDDV